MNAGFLIDNLGESWRPLGSVLEVHFIDVGQADCVLLELPNGDYILVDGGNHADADIIVDYLAAEKVTSLDYVSRTRMTITSAGWTR